MGLRIHRNVYDNFLLMGPKKCCQLCNAREKSIILFNIFSERRWAVSKCVCLFIQILISIILFITQIGIQILRCYTRNVFEGLVGAPFRRRIDFVVNFDHICRLSLVSRVLVSLESNVPRAFQALL